MLPRGVYEKVPGSKVYWIRYSDEDGTRHWEKCGNLSAAKDRLAIRQAEKLEGRQPQRPLAVPFGTLLDDAIAYAKAQNSSAQDLQWKLEAIRPQFGYTPARKITQSDILAWLEEQTEEREWSPASRNRYQAAWSLVFRVAIANKKARENPAHGIKRKPENNQRTRYLLSDEEQSLAEYIGLRFPPYLPVFKLALHTGMRASELLRGVVGDYSPATGMITIHQRKVRNAPDLRYVPASPVAVEAYTDLARSKSAGEALCTQMEDSTEPLTKMRYWFDPCVTEVGLVDLKWHDLRHTFASRLVMGGVPLAAVAQYLGHQNITMTMRYSHLSPNTHNQTVAILSGFGNGTASEKSEKKSHSVTNVMVTKSVTNATDETDYDRKVL
jgi:integrase